MINKIYVIIDEFGEYSDYQCNVIMVAYINKSDAQKAVDEFEEKQKNQKYKSNFSILELEIK